MVKTKEKEGTIKEGQHYGYLTIDIQFSGTEISELYNMAKYIKENKDKEEFFRLKDTAIDLVKELEKEVPKSYLK